LRRNEGPRGGKNKATHPELVAELKRRNQLDCALYDWVVQRLNKQIHAEGETFNRVRERFTRRNRTYNQLAAPVYAMYDFCKLKAKRVFHYRGYHRAK
jgi:tRNA isopentenyl-2-thiomethyl-A-37 hydroxylase MiaE